MRPYITAALTLGLLISFTSYGSCSSASEWKTWSNSQYLIHLGDARDNVTYENALESCKAENATLTSICSKEENEKLISWLTETGHKSFDVWIGYQCNGTRDYCQNEGNWRWMDGKSCNYKNWHQTVLRNNTEPKRGDTSAGLWNKNTYNTTRWFGSAASETKEGFICKTSTASPCNNSSEWRPWNSYCYRITWKDISYANAKRECQRADANLTSLCSKEEEEQLVTWLTTQNAKFDVWIGYECNSSSKCDKHNNWKWTDGNHCNYTNWHRITDEPTPGDKRARIRSIDHGNYTRWYGSGAMKKYDGYICKKATADVSVKSNSTQHLDEATTRVEKSAPAAVSPNVTEQHPEITTPVDKSKSGVIAGVVSCILILPLFVLLCAVLIRKRKKAYSVAVQTGDEKVQQSGRARHILNVFKRILCCIDKPRCIRECYRRWIRRNRATVNQNGNVPEVIMLQEMRLMEKRQQMRNGAGKGIPMQLNYRRVRPRGMNQPNVRMMQPRERILHPHTDNHHGQMVGRGHYPSIRPQHSNIRPSHPRLRANLPDGAQVKLSKPPEDSDHKVNIEELKNNLPSILEDKKVTAEFKSISMDSGLPRTAGKDPRNIKKNRFQNVVPYDYNRVKLHGKEMDYFNASYIDAGKPKAFIATQGPKLEGLCDFWYMIWQERVNVIVMVTSIIEGKKRKCHQYWPDQMKTAKYEEILVKGISMQNTKYATVRCFLAKRGNETRKIWQFHFRTWADQKVPLFSNALLNFWAKLKGALRASRFPVVVHCSAGIGRTGTFIALDILLDEMQMFKAIDVHRCITNLRKQRPYMVQNIEQYKFLYKALHNWVTLGPTWLHCQSFQQTLPTLFKPRGHEPPRAISQFQHIQKKRDMATKNPQFITEENVMKNRSPKILPALQYSVKLKTEVAGRNDYINAVFIDGYLSPNAYIATQAPLEDTKVDFWRMVLDTSCSVLVSLVVPGQMKPEEIYFPQNKGETVNITPFTITCKNKMGGNDVAIRHLAIAYSGKERFVQHLCINQPLVPKTAAPLICKLCHLTNRWLHLFPKSRAVVHCLDGATWTGVFCAALNIFHQINSEGAVDIMDVVQNLRIRRDTFIRNQAQYNLLFNLVQVYLSRPKVTQQQLENKQI